jgi:hypothetical protein
VATTSVASKKQVEKEAEPVEVEVEAVKVDPVRGTTDTLDEWEKEESPIQAVVDRLHDKAEKEVSRVLKVCDYRLLLI